MIQKHINEKNAQYMKVIQGDNISVIGYWQGQREVRKVNMYCIHQRPIQTWTHKTSSIIDKFEFIYRSYNKAADDAADVGARAVQWYKPEEKPHIQIRSEE